MTKEQAYDAKISPLMSQIIAICKEHEIPLLADFSLDNETGLKCTTMLLPGEWDTPESMVEAASILYRNRSAPMMLTVRDGNGDVTSMDAIL